MSYAQPAFKLLRDEGSDGTYEHLDQFGRVKVQHWKANGGSTVDRVEYAYDYASNRTLRDIPSSLYGTNDRDQTYGYDGLHRRVTKTVGGTTEQHYYNENWQCVEVRIGTESGPARQKYIWHPYYIDALACRFADVDSNGNFSGTDEVEFPTHDANFNVTALVNAAGTVFERYYYSPYGKLNVLDSNFAADADGASDVSNAFTYTGRQFDSESGVYQYRHRYYHAQLGRFVGRDPVSYVDGMSLYRPYFAPSGVDPFGLMDLWWWWYYFGLGDNLDMNTYPFLHSQLINSSVTMRETALIENEMLERAFEYAKTRPPASSGTYEIDMTAYPNYGAPLTGWKIETIIGGIDEGLDGHMGGEFDEKSTTLYALGNSRIDAHGTFVWQTSTLRSVYKWFGLACRSEYDVHVSGVVKYTLTDSFTKPLNVVNNIKTLDQEVKGGIAYEIKATWESGQLEDSETIVYEKGIDNLKD